MPLKMINFLINRVMKFIKITSFVLLTMTNSFSFGQNPKTDSSAKPIILFVCEHGAARSTIAAAWFNKLAKEKNLNYEAIFRGTDPDTSLSPDTKKGLLRDGFDIRGWQPQLVTQYDINSASEIITFDCTLPMEGNLEKPVYRWNGIPPVSKDYQVAKNQIADKVTALINELEQKKKL
jgi:arsenate reductase (thioredoxin)